MNRHDIRLSEVMSNRVISVGPGDRVEIVIEILLRNGISGAPVVDDAARLVGMISEKDLIRAYTDAVYNGMPAGKVKDYMSLPAVPLPACDSLFDAAEMFLRTHYRRIPIVDSDGQLVGIVCRYDILKTMQTISRETVDEIRHGN
jgi:CBS domain-containing protein